MRQKRLALLTRAPFSMWCRSAIRTATMQRWRRHNPFATSQIYYTWNNTSRVV